MIVASFGFVFVQAFRGKVPWIVAMPFAANLLANLLFMPIFSGLRNVPLAALSSSFGRRSSGARLPFGHAVAGSPWPKARTSCGCLLRPCCNCRSRR